MKTGQPCQAKMHQIFVVARTGNAKLGEAMHVLGADLDFQREQVLRAQRQHRCVQRLRAQTASQGGLASAPSTSLPHIPHTNHFNISSRALRPCTAVNFNSTSYHYLLNNAAEYRRMSRQRAPGSRLTWAWRCSP